MSCPTECRRSQKDPTVCVACGYPMPVNPLPQQRVDEFFNRFQEALEASMKIKRPDPRLGEEVDPTFKWFRHRCIERLRQGAKTYGNANFLRAEVDLVNEALEEQMDTANYILMELVKHSPDDTDAACIGSALAHSFNVVQDLLRYKEKLRGAF